MHFKVRNNVFILATLLSLFSCQKNSNQYQEEKYFDPKDISNLLLDNIDTFWDNDSLRSFTNYFKNYSGYTGGIELQDDGKTIAVAVFESQEIAINCMEGRIINVAIVITPGYPNEILKGKWWYAASIGSCVFANQWNTIIEVSISNSDFEEVKTILIETAAEISERIDLLSQ